MKNKINFVVLLITMFGLTALAVYLAQTLQIRQRVSPAAPESIPAAQTPENCELSFTVPVLGCYEGTCENDDQCSDGLVCDTELNLCVNSSCREDQDCECSNIGGGEEPEEETTTYSCDSPCTTNVQCGTANASYICYSATDTCRHTSYPEESDCQPPAEETLTQTTESPSPSPTDTATPTPTNTGGTSTPKPTGTSISGVNPSPTLPPDVPVTGVNLPTALAVIASAILIGGALIFAF